MAIQLVIRRETGLLKRLRLSPLPAWALVGAIFVSTLLVVLLQIILLLAVGRAVFEVPFPSDIETLAVALTLGTLSFTALGVAMSTLIRRQEAAGPVTAALFFVLLFLSGLFFPIPADTLLSQVASWVPVRAFIDALEFASTNTQPGMSPEAWHDLLVLVAWGVAGGVVTLWRFRWVPSRS
jgi:ABC-2 type transport system permease protein